MEVNIETKIHPFTSGLDETPEQEPELAFFPRNKNALPPISRLPKEILGHIFSPLRDDDGSSPFRAGCPDWIAVTHVCSEWRAFGLGYALLWNSIVDQLSDTWIMAFVQRSSGAPLDVNLKCWRHSGQVVDSLFAEAGRWRCIDFNVGEQEVHLSHLLDGLAKAPEAPHLESFSLHSYIYDSFDGPIDNSKIPFPPSAFNGSTSGLRQLRLEEPLYPVPGSPLLSSLTSLDCPGSLTQDSILALLASSPNLVYLRILPQIPVHVITIPIELTSPFATRPVRLSDLQTLSIDSRLSRTFLGLLQNLQLPSLQHLSFDCTLEELSDDTLMALSTHVHTTQRNAGPIGLLSLCSFEWGAVALTAWSSAQVEAASASKSRLDAFVVHESGFEPLIHLEQESLYSLYPGFASMLQVLQLSGNSIRELRVNRASSNTRAQWHAAFHSFDAVEVLEYHESMEKYPILKAATPDGTMPRSLSAAEKARVLWRGFGAVVGLGKEQKGCRMSS
ncbi:hypothetical protein EWM64_g3455 [Hericium alpestre]|uniref:F-box domain-containing protein n=1 Tax=Hericium alpestre TaxID=135208 RepID=A0A4Z0A282_9AGAM|nr:hypothetical protein EWM64_g3455 [Hericium alpestre]